MSFTRKQQRFIEEYTGDFNATQAAIRAGFSEKTAYSQGQRLLKNVEIAAAIQERISVLQMSADEAAIRMADAARFDLGLYLRGAGRGQGVDIELLIADGYGWMIKGIKYTPQGAPIYELWDGQRALEKIFDAHKPQMGDPERPIHIDPAFVEVIRQAYTKPATGGYEPQAAVNGNANDDGDGNQE